MKKQLFISCFSLLSFLWVNAQDVCPGRYWFIEGQAGVGYTAGETSFGQLLSPAAALSIGRSFNPVIATRLQVSGWQGKGGWSQATPEHPDNRYSFAFVQASWDALFNLTTIFGQHKPDRCFNLIGIVGVGYAHSFDYDNIQGINADKTVNSAVARAGLQGNFRLSRSWNLNLELIGNGINDSFNAKSGSVDDWQFNLLAGFTYKFGHKATKPAEATNTTQIAALNQTINAQRQEIENLQQQLQAKPRVEERVTTIVEKIATSYIPFSIGKSHIANDQLIHVNHIARYLNEHPDAMVTITGYADAKTGTKEVNQMLSQKRAQAVADVLIKDYHIASHRIHVDGKGDAEQPFEKNNWNRVAIMLTR